MAAESENSDVTEFTEKSDEIANGVDKQKQIDVLLIQIERRKRSAKTKVTKLRHELERLCVKDSEVTDIESMIEQLWAALEDAQEILEELSAFYVEVGEDTGKNEAFKESETIEKDVQRAIVEGQNAIKVRACKVVDMNTPLSENTTDRYEQSAREDQLNESHHSHNDRNRYLKPLKVSTFNGDKRKFEDFWALFTSLVDESTEPVNLKMARLRQCLTGNVLEAIRGLGVTVHEYEEAKQILKTKYGGMRRLLRAYLDQLEQAPLIRSNDIHALEKFVDLVGITVVKLQAERRDGELEDGTFHSLLVKKLPNRRWKITVAG